MNPSSGVRTSSVFPPSQRIQHCYRAWPIQVSHAKQTVHPPTFLQTCVLPINIYKQTLDRWLLRSLSFPIYQKSRWRTLLSHLHWLVVDSVLSDRHVFTARQPEGKPYIPPPQRCQQLSLTKAPSRPLARSKTRLYPTGKCLKSSTRPSLPWS